VDKEYLYREGDEHTIIIMMRDDGMRIIVLFQKTKNISTFSKQ
jgi:hypothetical protein